MSTTPIYESTTGEFALIQVTGYWRDRPLQERGDGTHQIYYLKCHCTETDYTTLALNTPMTDDATAGVIGLPWTNSNAYFIGDSNRNEETGGVITFLRKFSTIPATQTGELVGSRSFPFPSIRGYNYVAPTRDTDEQILFPTDDGSGNTSPAALYVDSQYYLKANIPASLPTVFQVTENGNNVDYVSNGRTVITTLYVQDTQSEDPSARISKTFNETRPATVPDYSTYQGYISGGTDLIVDVQVSRYQGDIFVVETYKMKAQ